MNTGLNRTKWEPYVWLLPSILLIAIFVVFPILIVFKLSFSEISKAGVIGGFIEGAVVLYLADTLLRYFVAV